MDAEDRKNRPNLLVFVIDYLFDDAHQLLKKSSYYYL